MNKGVVFEKQVLELLKKMGFDAEMTKSSGDGGIDIIAHKHDDIVGGKYIIQCKNWLEPPIRDLYGVVISENANKGILITQSSFTSQALEFAKGKHLELINGERISQLFKKHGLTDVLASEQAEVNQDESMISDLKLQLSKSPQNIINLKAFGDFLLLKGRHEEATDYYKRILPLKPEIQTKRLHGTYLSGLYNYAVALALLKKYDEAFSIYKKISEERIGPTELNEAYLYHYLGLFDLAKETYEKIKKYNSSSSIDEGYEQAYMKEFLTKPYLSMYYLDNESELKGSLIPLDTPNQKTQEELIDIGYDNSFGSDHIETILQIATTFGKFTNIEIKTDYTRIYTLPSLDELNQENNKWRDIIAQYKLEIMPESAEKNVHLKNQIIRKLIAIVERYVENLTKIINYFSVLPNVYTPEAWESLKTEFTNPIETEHISAPVQEGQELHRLFEEYVNIKNEITKKWEKHFKDERIFWQEKLSKRTGNKESLS
jgi:tetratricopeptide (TPR) repeat protein